MLNKNVDKIECALAIYNKACNQENNRAVDAQRLYIEANCVHWLSELLEECKIDQDFTYQPTAPDLVLQVKELVGKYDLNIRDVEPILKANQEGRLVIRSHTKKATGKKPCCWYSKDNLRECLGLFYNGSKAPINKCGSCYFWKDNVQIRVAAI